MVDVSAGSASVNGSEVYCWGSVAGSGTPKSMNFPSGPNYVLGQQLQRRARRRHDEGFQRAHLGRSTAGLRGSNRHRLRPRLRDQQERRRSVLGGTIRMVNSVTGSAPRPGRGFLGRSLLGGCCRESCAAGGLLNRRPESHVRLTGRPSRQRSNRRSHRPCSNTPAPRSSTCPARGFRSRTS
jgi:hypothetical protein